MIEASRSPLERLTFFPVEAGITYCFVNLLVTVLATNSMCSDRSDRGSDHPAMLEAMIKAKQGEYRICYQ